MDTPTSHDVEILLKACRHMVEKAAPMTANGRLIGYKTPVREFQRVRSKLARLESKGGKTDA